GVTNICGVGTPPPAASAQCTATNVSGNPYSGTLCGGAFTDNCTPGALYTCTGGARGTVNNCTLAQTCSTGCLTGVNDTPVTANIGFATPVASDVCFADTAPLTLSSNATTGGNYVQLTATLTPPHTSSAFVNFEGATLDVPPVCGNLIPLTIAPGATSVSWVQPTNVVTTPTTVPLNVLISYIETATGRLRNLVSVSSPLTLNPGGTLPVPPLVSFRVMNAGGTPISTIPGGTNAFAIGTLPAATPAPVGGTRVTVTSSLASAFVTDGSFVILPACTTNSDFGVLTATSSLLSNLPVTVSATTGGATLTQNVVVTPPVLQLQSLTLTPGAVIGGGSLTATVTLNRVVQATDSSSTVSVRVSPGSLSNVQVATFAGCTGTPACSGSFTVPIGANSASVTITTS